MPPVGFWASSSGVYAGANLTFLVPTAAREQDVLLIAFVVPSSSNPVAPAGWDLLAADAVGGSVLMATYLFRHAVVAGDPAQVVINVGASLSPQPLGMMLLYRSIDLAAAIVDHNKALIGSAATAFPAPSLTLVTYSDLDVLMYYAKDAAGTATFTMPAGANQRGPTLHGPGGSGGGSLAVADILKEAVGATGTEQATCSTAQTGMASAYAVKALPTLVAPSVVPDIQGAIGLPAVGV